MVFPVAPLTPVLMVALQPLTRSSWAGRLPGVAVGDAFWSNTGEAAGLVAAGQAEYAPEGTPEPPPEPPWTARQTPGFGAGTSNCTGSG